MRRRQAVSVAAVLLLVATLASGGPLNAQERYTMRIMYGTDFWALPVVAGLELGFFSDEGLNVSIQQLPYGALGLTAVVSGSAHMASTANTRVVNAALQGFPVRAIANAGVGYNARLVVPAEDRSTRHLSDLVGRRLGAQVGTGVFATFVNYLEDQGFSLDDFQVVDLRNVDLPASLQRGDIDFALMWEPAAAQAIAAGIARVLVDAPEISLYHHSPMVTSLNVIQEQPELLRRWARAWVRTMNWLEENREAAEDLQHELLLLQGLDVDRSLVSEAMRTIRYDQPLISDEDIQAMLRTSSAYVRLGMLPGLPERFEDYIDNSFIEEALRELEAERNGAAER